MQVHVISAYPAVRAGLAALARAQPGWEVVGEDSPDALAAAATRARDAAPDVVLADLDGLADIEAVDAWLEALRPASGIVVIGQAQPAPVRGRASREVVRALAEVARVAEGRGLAFGALRRDATTEEIVAAIAAVAGGLVTLDRRLAGELLAASERALPPASEALAEPTETLTARELEVLQLLAQGLPNKLIAVRLHISEHTAKFHVSAIMMKLGAASRTEAVTSAARRGLLML